MLVNGRAIAEDIKGKLREEIKGRKIAPTLFIFSVGDNSVSEKFLAIKKKYARDISVRVIEKRFEEIDTAALINEMSLVTKKADCGLIVQLPLPKNIDTQAVLNTISPTHDVDVLSNESFKLYEEGTLAILPPVIGAIKEILFRHNVFVGNKNVVIVGKGKLVGFPAAIWFKRHESNVHIIDTKTINPESLLREADIIVSGAGRPHFIKSAMIKSGVVILDAGTSTEFSVNTSESTGKLAGDADPDCAEKASLFTPVPGGIGPVTVAKLFENLIELTRQLIV